MPLPQGGNQGQEEQKSEILNIGKAYKEVFSLISKQWVENTAFHCSNVVFSKVVSAYLWISNKAQKLTRNSKILTTVFHLPRPLGRPWVWVSASPWRPWLQEGDRHCRIPPETCSGEDTCTGCQEKTLKRKMYTESIRYLKLLSVSQLFSKKTFSFPS